MVETLNEVKCTQIIGSLEFNPFSGSFKVGEREYAANTQLWEIWLDYLNS